MAERCYIFNASPLILLARVNRLDLLAALGTDLRVPETVFREIDAGNCHDGAGDRLRAANAVRIVPDPADDDRVSAWHIDAGETKVLSLALSAPGAIAVLDDLAARRCAEGLGIDRIGTAGLVALFKVRGDIPSAAALLAALRGKGMHMSARLEAQVLRLVGETAAPP